MAKDSFPLRDAHVRILEHAIREGLIEDEKCFQYYAGSHRAYKRDGEQSPLRIRKYPASYGVGGCLLTLNNDEE